MLSTFRPSKTSKLAKSNSLSNGKKQSSSGLLEMSGPGRAPSGQTFFKPPSDAADENSSMTQRSHHAVGTKRRHFTVWRGSTRRPLVRLAVTVQDVVPLRGREGGPLAMSSK